MISLVFGTPGAGKTTFGAWCALRAAAGSALTVGRYALTEFDSYDHIYTNFAVSGIPLLREFSPDVLRHDCAVNSLFVIDEVAQLWDARNFKTFDQDVKRFFALHRHYRCDFILISQGYSDCDLRIRNLAEQLFLLEPWLLHYSKITPIIKYCRLENGQINEGYEPSGWRLIDRRAVYPYFDSYECEPLPPAEILPPIIFSPPPAPTLINRMSARLHGFPKL